VQFTLPSEVEENEPCSTASIADSSREQVDYTINNVPWYEHQQIHRHNRLLGRFVSDVTVPNGTIVLPKVEFVKTWRMRNEGKTRWPENTTLVFVGGDLLSKNSVKSINVPSIEPGSEVDLSVEMESPLRPGRYISYWRLCHPSGKRFGQRIWVHIKVEDPNAPATLTGSCQAIPGVDIPLYLMNSTALAPAVPALRPPRPPRPPRPSDPKLGKLSLLRLRCT
jgi:hypothetical protein